MAADERTPGRRNADEVIAVALAAGCTWRQAARTAHVSAATVGRRMGQPAFRREVARLRAEMVDRTVGRTAAAGSAAVGALVRLLGAEAESVRVAAARALLDAGLKYREHVELADRLAELEATTQGHGGEDA